jgi:hypothetical protein
MSMAHDHLDPLSALHDDYVWDVNAAVAEGREDLVRTLVDDYFELSVRVMMGQQAPGCGRQECVMCTGRESVPGTVPAQAQQPRRWLRLPRRWLRLPRRARSL